MPNIDDVLQTMKKWLWIEDENQIKIMIGVAIASQFSGDPVWMFIIGPSGSTKTEILRSLRTSPRIYTLDTFTDKSFISGFSSKKSGEYDLLPQLNGKLLVVKDFTNFLETGSRREKDATFGVLRQAYDGFYESKFGSLKGKKSYDSTFGIIGGVTGAIDHYSKIHSLLGERFLKLRVNYNRKESIKAAFQHSGDETNMRTQIAEAVRICLDWYSTQTSVPLLSTPTSLKLQQLADILAILRSPVPRDWKHDVDYVLDAEVGTRLGKQLVRLAKSLFQMKTYDYSLILRVARDSVFPERLRIVEYLKKHSEATITGMSDTLKYPRNAIKYGCEDLFYLGACDRRVNSNTYYYKLKDDFHQSLLEAKL